MIKIYHLLPLKGEYVRKFSIQWVSEYECVSMSEWWVSMSEYEWVSGE